MKKMTFLQHIGLLVLRISFSGAMLTHGIPKLEKLIAGGDIKFADPFGLGMYPSLVLAVIGEVVAPILIILGFKSRFVAFPAFITMFVAFFMAHGGDPFKDREMAFLYMIAFFAIGMVGAGKFSVDGAMGKTN